MLENNTEVIEKVLSLSAEQIQAIIRDNKLHNYGNGMLSEQFMSSPKGVLGALFNSDLDYVLNEAIIKNPNGIAAGLFALSKMFGLSGATLILPNDYAVDQLKEAADKLDFELKIEISDMVNVRKYRDFVKVHVIALLNLSEVLTGNKEKTIVSIEDEIKEIDFDTPVSELVSVSECKAVEINHFYYPAASINKEISLNSGVIKTIESETCLVEYAKNEILNFRRKSCGICTFCREGLFQLYTILSDITNAKAKKSDVELMSEIAESMLTQTNCTLGKTAARPVLSLIKNWEDELLAHTKKKVCPTGKCKAFMSIYIDPSVCEGCGDCIDVCPQNCIEGKRKYISMIDEFDCTKCGKCLETCENGSIKMTSGRLPKLPTRLTKVGRFKK